jgi:hypothetical protein
MLKYAEMSLVAFVSLLALALPSSAGAALASHRAIYDLVLDESNNKAGLASADGRMAFEITGSTCDGWTVNFRMVNRFRPSEENERLVDTRSSSFESGDGLQMRYAQSEYVDNVLDSETMVSARRNADGGPGMGEFSKPDKKTFSLVPQAIFPVQHQIRLMSAAEHGASRDVSIVFDGSDEDKSYRTISFIGPRKEPGKSGVTYGGRGADVLAGMPSWPVSISYYDERPKAEDSGEQTPVYQVSFEMFENGVAGGLVLNYGDFTLRGKLSFLEFLSQPSCN